ncbi:MAG TPA: hypothetical protein PLR20_09770 [Syntrophales bacterium]|nr:hypothetical protein [Syntrophales bacterium]HOX93165.1 hypothetical protein [Syntrophales bacterium]HPI57656.1 hypothetical protein [Syntrophales bacterium]HPN25331.1 hypothetical protein [Syntrophales bacterium]HQM29623.1 hypothetical protein [Syntrophales bacterium]
MRTLLIVFVVFGLVVVCGAPAPAVDIKVSGTYYAAGVYESNHSLRNEDGRELLTGSGRASSSSFVSQRLRLQPEFKIAEGLTLSTRFDAVEKKWGDSSWGKVHTWDNTNRPVDAAAPADDSGYTVPGNRIRTQENLEWERAYVDFNTAIGRFMVGYFNCICYGTKFLDSDAARAGVKWMYPMGPWTFVAQWEKPHEGGSYGTGGSAPTLAYSNKDLDVYSLSVDYRWKSGTAGAMLQYYYDGFYDYSGTSGTVLNPVGGATAAEGFVRKLYTINPYAKATFGSLAIEAEGWYGFGKWADFRDSRDDVDLEAYALYAKAKYSMGAFYVGALGSIETGDDRSSTDKVEGSVLGSSSLPLFMGQAWDPFLLMFNNPMNNWTGNWSGYGTGNAAINYMEDNCMLWQIFAGWNATPKLLLEVAYGQAKADEQGTAVDDDYGAEFDLTATYKIYNNLSYMIGFGYWWVGDYFKGTSSSNQIDDDYIVMHKLTLSF